MEKESQHHVARRGQSLVEYGLILVLVTVVCIVSLTAIFGKTGDPMSTVANTMP